LNRKIGRASGYQESGAGSSIDLISFCIIAVVVSRLLPKIETVTPEKA